MLFDFKHYNVIKEQIGEITDSSLIHFMTFGKWHSYELLYYLLSFTGKSNVTITTFGLSEEGLRSLQKAKNEGYINDLTMIINLSARVYKKKFMFYLKNVADTVLLQNIHAKLFIIEGENFNAIVNQSANFSTNPTNESGVISTMPNDIITYKDYINKTIKLSKQLNFSENVI